MSEPQELLQGLVERSRRLGSDPELVVHGGGNTSSKGWGVDHLGRRRRSLLVKGSGSDLATVVARDFPALWLDDLLAVQGREAMTDEEMVAYLLRCLADPTAGRPSIETLLHAFLPATHVDHTHADTICALTKTPDGPRHVAAALGDDVAYVPYVRPGFALSRLVGDLAGARAVVLAHHGLVTWGESHAESEDLTHELVDRAGRYLENQRTGATQPRPAPVHRPSSLGEADADELLVRLRGRLSGGSGARKVLRVDPAQRRFADRPDVAALAALGPATADHILRLHTGSVVVEGPAEVGKAVDAWSGAYTSFFDRHRHLLNREAPDLPMHDPLPTSFLVPGLGAVAAAPTARRARVVGEVAEHTHAVAARALDAYATGAEGLGEEDVFGVDYWPLELHKLTLAPPPAELAGMVAVITGAASGIGRTVARELSRRGAAVVAADRDGDGLAATVEGLDRDATTTVTGDLTDEAVVEELVRSAVSRFGGIDAVVLNAGIAPAGTLAELDPAEWRRAFEVNATSHFLLTRRLWPVLEVQGLGGSLVYVVTRNAVAPGIGFGAYSASKAAMLQLARVAAVEGGAIGVRANVVNPDGVFDGSRLWSPELRRQRAEAHGVPVEEIEDHYADRNLLKVRVTTADVAEAVAWLASDRSKATTGTILTVDGGNPAGFPR
ncbi:MAG: hypothetical protein QOD63_3141 [Actinomycetota bacterium]|nr:hypothetical protein [Actinomycetota bacterium]